ncbi:tonB-system energizer ExbB [Vineibacter terrae]
MTGGFSLRRAARQAWLAGMGLLLTLASLPVRAQEATPGAPPPVPPALPPEAAPAVVPTVAPILPVDLSPWGMFQSADIVVKVVMIGLATASVLTWTVWLAKTVELASARRQARRALAALDEVQSLAEATMRVGSARATVPALVRAASSEVKLSGDLLAEGVKERVVSRLERIEAAAGRSMTRGTGILATIGSTAPFIGLFGTVWGIMNSFIGISKAQTTNLAVVAPGIAEALLATALGLVAAIPAVVIYNVFARSISGYRMLLADASAAILRLVSRDLDRGTLPLSKAAE